MHAHFNTHGCTIIKGLGLADTYFKPDDARKALKNSSAELFDQSFQQIDMPMGAGIDHMLAQQAVVKHATDVMIIAGLFDQGIKFSVDINGLSVLQLVFKNADMGLQAQTLKENTAGAGLGRMGGEWRTHGKQDSLG